VEIVFSTHHLASLGGSETYLVTVAEQLERLGHAVTIHALELGEMADIARERGLRVATGERDLPDACDAVLAQDGVTSLALADRYPTSPQLFIVHADAIDLVMPPQLPDVAGALVVLNDRVARRMGALAREYEIVRLRQPIDLQRFAPRGPIAPRPRRVLLLGNYLWGDRRDLIEEACAELGIPCVQAGRHGTATAAPELAIGEADIVVGKARTVLEAMACGRAAYVYDHNGGDGWVTPERYPALEADNFAGRATPEVIDAERLRHDLAAYRPEMGTANRDLALLHHGAGPHAEALVAAVRRLAPRAARPPGPLRELGRLVRLQWQAESRAAALAVELQLERVRLRELEAERDRLATELGASRGAAADAAAASRALDDLTATRRYRLAQALARPLDRLRALAAALRRRRAAPRAR